MIVDLMASAHAHAPPALPPPQSSNAVALSMCGRWSDPFEVRSQIGVTPVCRLVERQNVEGGEKAVPLPPQDGVRPLDLEVAGNAQRLIPPVPEQPT